MTSAAFVQRSLRNHIAPPTVGSAKERIRHASRSLRWSFNRTKDAWYADPRISINADEMRAVEEATGLRYARQELRTNEQLIAKAEALLDGPDAGFYSAFVTALVALARPVDRAGTEGQ